ncbi:hypothetical protein BTUL_0056g00410 [Botrytis tulipae]|uniref:Chromo domain-containing protein n=1 Tax=Botrytis tulipae TaxID=87230 RepID=A0A4Z1ETU4_9HELO|nr:hypothetical protein BTUL_0056g00410 [Botrytis tulipae]
MARLNNTLIVYKRKPYKPVPSLVAAYRRNTLESRKGNGMEIGGVAKKGKQATTPGESSVQKPSETVSQLNRMVGPRAPVAQMVASTADGEETNRSSTVQVMAEPKAHIEERVDGEGDDQKDKEDNEAGVQNKPQQEVALPNSLQSRGPSTPAKKAFAKKTAELQNSRLRQEKRTPLSRLKKAQQSTPFNKARSTEHVTTEKDTPRRGGSRRKLADAMLTTGEEAEVVASAKKPKPSGNPSDNPKASPEVIAPVEQAVELTPVVEQTKEPTPIAEQPRAPTPVIEEAKGLISILEQAEDENGSEEENVTETIAKNSYQPVVVHQSRLDGENNKQWLIEWKGYPKQKDWTWEATITLSGVHRADEM